MEERETGIPCFECGERSGIDCPGRKPDEATRCNVCLEEFMRQIDERHKRQIDAVFNNPVDEERWPDDEDCTSSDIDEFIL